MRIVKSQLYWCACRAIACGADDPVLSMPLLAERIPPHFYFLAARL
jgi:hypothetical protein